MARFFRYIINMTLLIIIFQPYILAESKDTDVHDFLSDVVPGDTLSQTQSRIDTVSANDRAYNLLPGVAITADRSLHKAGASYYTPTKKEKQLSADANMLLNFMMIPQISKNTEGEYVSPTGIAVKYFINGHPATPQDLTGMNMMDVRKVCYLDHPSDAKYLGADYVVEFIIQEYEYGGYTKLYDAFYFLGEYHFSEYLTSKFNYKRMTFDIFARADNFRYFKDATKSREVFRFPVGEVAQSNIPTHSNQKAVIYPAQFRAIYSHGNTYISNQIGYEYSGLKLHEVEGRVLFDYDLPEYPDMKQQGYDYSISQPHDRHSVTWDGYASIGFDKGWSLAVQSNVSFAHYVKDYEYHTDQPFSIMQYIRENSVEGKIDATLKKQLNTSNSISLNITGNLMTSHSKYRGDSDYTNSFSFPVLYGGPTYTYSSSKISLWAFTGMSFQWNRLNDIQVNSVFPYVAINLNYSPTSKSSGSLWMQYTKYSPTASQKNPTPTMVSEFIWRQGNPEVKPYPKLEVGPSYTWSPTKIFTLGVNMMYTHLHNILRPTYTLGESGTYIVRSYANSGSTNSVYAGMSAALRLFDNKLSLSIRPSATFYRGKGVDMPDVNSYSLSAAANLYFGKFYAGADCNVSNKTTSYNMDELYKRKPFYSFSFGWGNGKWSAHIDLYNIFKTSWNGRESYVYSSVYSKTETDISIGSRQTAYFRLSYTIDYGKKIGKNNELNGSMRGASSAVL